MLYVLMCAGKGTRWNNYQGVPKHLIKINGEPLLGRTTRLLKKYGINNYIITTNDVRYKEYGQTRPQSYTDCEVDRFEDIDNEEICYLYGDVYYTEEAIKNIVNTPAEDILFFGSDWEIFAIKIINKELFFEHKNRVKKLFLNGEINRCIGWEVYRSLHNIPFEEHYITDRYFSIKYGTDDIDYPAYFEKFIESKK